MAINTVTISGNLTRDPELRQTNSGKSVVSVRLGAKGYGDTSVFVDVTAWDKLAELLATATRKGSGLTVAGRLEYREWADKDGNKRNALSIVAQDVVLPPKPADTDDVDF